MVASGLQYRVRLETELKRYSKLREEDVTTINEWIKSQPHLPPVLDVQIAHFLHASYYDLEVTKNAIEHYFRYKNTMPDFFGDWDPMSKDIIDYGKNSILAGFLPKQSPMDPCIVLLRLADPCVDKYSFNVGVKWLLMSVTSRMLQDGQQNEFKLVYDTTNFSLSHVMRNPLSSLKNYIDFGQKASAIRVVEIHILNSSSVVQKLFGMIRPFMNKQVRKMINFHVSADSFFQTLPTEVVPSDYGGSGPPLETLSAENTQRVEEMRDALIAHSEQRTDETRRANKKTGKQNSTDDSPQSLRQLEID